MRPTLLLALGLALGWAPSVALAQDDPVPETELVPEHAGRLPVSCRELCASSIVGFTSMALGSAWFLWGGDSRGASDFGTIMVGGGATALLGSALFGAGSLQSGLFNNGRKARGGTGLSLGLQAGGNAVTGESRPLRYLPEATLLAHPAPRLAVSMEVGARLSGTDIDLDPRDGTGDQVALEHQATRGRVALLARTRLGPLEADHPVWLGIRPLVLQSSEAVVYQNGESLRLDRRALIFAAGMSIDPLRGHRLSGYLGPRWDQTNWDLDGVEGDNGNWGPVYGEIAWRTADQPLLGGWLNLDLEYTHSKFSGTGFKLSAMSGFFGPVVVGADWRRALGSRGWLLHLGLDAELSDTTITLRTGVLAPSRSP